MPKKRGNNEGSIVKRKDGLYMAQVTIGRDPETGKPRSTNNLQYGHAHLTATNS